jgi:hypothetical protein
VGTLASIRKYYTPQNPVSTLFFQTFSAYLKQIELPVSLLKEQLKKFTKNVKTRYKISENK